MNAKKDPRRPGPKGGGGFPGHSSQAYGTPSLASPREQRIIVHASQRGGPPVVMASFDVGLIADRGDAEAAVDVAIGRGAVVVGTGPDGGRLVVVPDIVATELAANDRDIRSAEYVVMRPDGRSAHLLTADHWIDHDEFALWPADVQAIVLRHLGTPS